MSTPGFFTRFEGSKKWAELAAGPALQLTPVDRVALKSAQLSNNDHVHSEQPRCPTAAAARLPLLSRTVYVGNLSSAIDEASIRALFQHFGTVTEVRLAGQPNYQTRYCFVEFQTPEQAMQALSLNGLHLADRDIRVNIAKQSLGGGGGGGGMAPAMGMYGMQAGMQAGMYGMQAGFPGAYGAYGAMPGMGGMPGGRARVQTPQDAERLTRTIHVDNVDPAITEFQMAQFFGVFGAVTAVRLAGMGGAPGRKAWVEFQDASAAQGAFQMDNQMLGMLAIRITPSKSVIHTNGLTITPAMQAQMAQQAQQVAASHAGGGAPGATGGAEASIGPTPRPGGAEPKEAAAPRRSRSRSPVRPAEAPAAAAAAAKDPANGGDAAAAPATEERAGGEKPVGRTRREEKEGNEEEDD
eukprot:jgi/Tetstr1/426262/TSEL_016581.t2